MSLIGKKHTDDSADFSPYGDNFLPVLPVDYSIHTQDHPFCEDMSCPCHEDQSAVNDLAGHYHNGLVSREDADRIYRGQTL
jgi:hypothetical protein